MAYYSALRSISFLWLGSLFGAALAFLTQAYLARTLGPQEFGLFAATLATATLVAPFAGFGIAQALLKIYGKHHAEGVKWIRAAEHTTYITITVSTIAMLVWAFTGPHNTQTKELLIIFSLYLSGQSYLELGSSKLQIQSRFELLAAWQMLPHITRLILILSLFILSFKSATIAAACYAATSLLMSAIGLSQLRKLSNNKKKADSIKNREIFKCAWPFALATIFNVIYTQSDIVLIKYINGDEAAGAYHIAFTILLAIYLLPGAIYQKYLLPKIHAWIYTDPAKVKKIYNQGNIIMGLLGLGITACVWATAEYFITAVFGPEFQSSIVYLKILSLTIPTMFIAFSAGAVLATGESMRVKVALMGLVAILNIILNLAFIPKYGPMAATWTTVFSNLLLMLLYLHYSRKMFKTLEAKTS